METDPNESATFRMLTEMLNRNILQFAFDVPMVEILAWDAVTLKIVAMNARALAVSGQTLRQVIQMEVTDLYAGVSPERVAGFIKKLRVRKGQEITFRIQHLDNEGRARFSRVVVRYLSEPRPTVVAFVQNITGYLDAHNAAVAAEDLLTMALESLPDGFVLYDADDRLVICNKNYRKIYASSAAAMKKGATFEEILQYGLDRGEYADGIGRETEWLQERLAAHRAANVSVEQQLASGQWLRIVERLTPNGGRVGLRIDITEMKNNEKMLARNARTDHLTGLMNRRGLYEEINSLAAKLTADEHIAILHIDLDKFKSVNDAQGHDAGDHVLQHCAAVLCDLIEDCSSVARVGGDEFIVFFKSRESNNDIFALCRKIIARISVPVVFRDRICCVGASIGFAIYQPLDVESVGSALTGADIALHHAKLAGRGQCRMFEERMRDGAIRQIQLGHEIRDGIAADQFEPFFQPQVDTQSGEILGFEALIRWRHPVRGLVPPLDFLPAAERAGLMGQLDNIILDKSCAAAAVLNKWGMPNASISVNMSMSLLQDTEILARLKRHTDRHGISPGDLRLELLESTLLDERSDIIVKNVHKLIGNGYAVELDDFGTGHAAIATLRKFSVSRIKIDRSLVQDIDTDAELRVITSAIINLAKQLGINALAEGVETTEEQDTLNEMGCFCAQGYLHARPMPIVDLQAWIENHCVAKSAAKYHQTPALDSIR